MDDPASYFLFLLSQDTTTAPVSDSIGTILLKIASVFLLVAANGFFVTTEFALVGVRRSRIEALANSGHKTAKLLLELLDHLNAYISATQLGITLSSLALGWIGEPAVAALIDAPLFKLAEVTGLSVFASATALHTISFIIAFSIITFLHIVLGELAPKTLALERAERVALSVALPMKIFYKVFQLPIRFLDWTGTRTVRLFGLHPSGEHASVYTEDEIRQLINISHKSGHLGKEEQRLINRVFEFSETLVREAMVPRTQMSAIPDTSSLQEIAKAFENYKFSRLPVYKETLDDVVGFIHSKDVMPFLLHPETFTLKEVLQDPVYVVDTARLEDVLRQMQKAKAHFAFVVDEHGGVEGILTLEDLLEEIVGDISDEHDDEVNEQITAEKDGTFVLDGGLAVRDLNRRLHLNVPESEAYTTIAGFLMSEAGQVLKTGEEVKYDSLVFRIERVEKRRIVKIRLEKIEAEETSEQEATTKTATN
jgi:CBS domain containing-hemolysin-like protein